MSDDLIILGSRSPRRLQLLESLVDPGRIRVCAPDDPSEPGFDDCETEQQIEQRLAAIVAGKLDAVSRQVAALPELADPASAVVIVADTIVVARWPDGTPIVLGQPEGSEWQRTVRRWMHDFLSGRSHEVRTGFAIRHQGQTHTETVRTLVTMEKLSDEMIDWYVGTGESQGKAGGYAIQGHASALIRGFAGSITNVVGLPLFELARALQTLNVPGIWWTR